MDYARAGADADGNKNSESNTITDRNARSHSYTESDADCHRNSYTVTDCNFDQDPDTRAATHRYTRTVGKFNSC